MDKLFFGYVRILGEHFDRVLANCKRCLHFMGSIAYEQLLLFVYFIGPLYAVHYGLPDEPEFGHFLFPSGEVRRFAYPVFPQPIEQLVHGPHPPVYDKGYDRYYREYEHSSEYDGTVYEYG